MSFLNPMQLPVKRYSSDDDYAPKINQSSRQSGDIKTIVKACLVTGYGNKQGAGWTLQNETDFTAGFISPDFAMSDYKFIINDNSASTTTWSYIFQGNTYANNSMSVSKTCTTNVDKTKSNKWQMLVTERGFCLIELYYVPIISGTVARITYFGQIKSAVKDTLRCNMAFIVMGQNQSLHPSETLKSNAGCYFNIDGHINDCSLSHAAYPQISTYGQRADDSIVNITDAVYLYAKNKSTESNKIGVEMLGMLPGWHIKTVASANRVFSVRDVAEDGISAVVISLGRAQTDTYWYFDNSCPFELMLSTDFWGY